MATPELLSTTPTNGATGVTNKTKLVIQFTVTVAASGTGVLKIFDDGQLIQTINAADATINFGDRRIVTFNTSNLTLAKGRVTAQLTSGSFNALSGGEPSVQVTQYDFGFEMESHVPGRTQNRLRVR